MTTLGKRRRRSPLWVLACVLGAFALLLGVRYKEAYAERRKLDVSTTQSAASQAEEGSAPAPSSAGQFVSGENMPWQPRIALTGTLLPVRDASLSFKGMGRLVSVRVKVGDRVKAGQLLGELDASDLRAQLRVAHAQVNTAEVQYTFAKDNEDRMRNLYERKAVSEAQWTGEHQRSELARVQLEAARAQVEVARAAFEGAELLAPFAGTVVEAPSAAGSVVTPGVVLFRLQDTSALKLSATLSPADASFAKLGARVEILDDVSGSKARSGQITAVMPAVDSQTRRLPIIAEFNNEGEAPLLANVFVRATLLPTAPITVLKLPATAIRAGSQDEVAVVDDGHLRIVRIAYARAEDGSLLVRSGLSASDRVLAAPGSQIKHGDTWPEVTQ
jgi:RND family efflux transporter MFP subunit